MKNESINKENFLNFPNKLNNIVIVLLVTVYAIVIFWALSAFFPKYNYIVVPEYEHVSYNYDIDAYIKMSTNVANDNNGKITVKHTDTAYIYANYNKLLNDVMFQFSALKKDGGMEYISGIDYWNSSSAPTVHTMQSSKVIEGDQYDTLFGKLQYSIINDKGDKEIRYATFAEKMITLKKSETKSSKFKSINSLPGKFNFSVLVFQPSSDTDNYSITNTITLNNKGEKFHIDYQAFGLTEDGDIFPVGGIYNYYINETGSTSINVSSKVAKNLGLKTIFVKVYYTNLTEGKTEICYKVDIDTFLG